jgi:glutathione S-transferase
LQFPNWSYQLTAQRRLNFWDVFYCGNRHLRIQFNTDISLTICPKQNSEKEHKLSDQTTEVIFHAYSQSPVAEKVRVALGIKGLAWRKVEIPRLPPKPFLTALTGGYRRTPVMQIGADIYCDSQCIIRELERRFPAPTIMPTSDQGLMWCLSRWTDGALFDQTVRHILGAAGDQLDKDFAKDRGRLYLGEDWAAALKQANADLPHLVSQLRAPLSWLNAQMSDGREFLLGPQPAAIDAQFYHVVWFLRGRWAGGPSFLSEFKDLVRWETNIQGIGHGTFTDMDPHEAILRAKSVEPTAETGVAPNEPLGLSVGQSVTLQPDVNGGEQPVTGTLRYADAETVVIDRSAADVGNVCVHFPRSGYRINLL